MSLLATHPATTTGHGSFPPTTSAGGDTFLEVEGQPVILVGQEYQPHSDGDSTHTPKQAAGSSLLEINGKPAARIGDALDCGDVLAKAGDFVFVGA